MTITIARSSIKCCPESKVCHCARCQNYPVLSFRLRSVHSRPYRCSRCEIVTNRCQLSQMDPRDGIVLLTEVDDQYDKLAVERRC